MGHTNNSKDEMHKVSKHEEKVRILENGVNFKEGTAKHTPSISEASFQFKQVATEYQSNKDKEGNIKKQG